MKNRDYKQFTKNSFYHIYNRGNAKIDIFLDDNDYRMFISLLKENIHGIEIDEVTPTTYKGSK